MSDTETGEHERHEATVAALAAARAEVTRLRSAVEAVRAIADQAVADSRDPANEGCEHRDEHDCHSAARLYLAESVLRALAPVQPSGETESAGWLCRHGKYRHEHTCDDHLDHERSAVAPARVSSGGQHPKFDAFKERVLTNPEARAAYDEVMVGGDIADGVVATLEESGFISTALVLSEVAGERARQDAQWGEQNHPDGTGAVWEFCSGQHAGWAEEAADDARRRCQEAHERTWGDTFALILNEEVAEAFAEEDPTRLREELVQVAAVAVAWVEAIDRRAAVLSEGQEASR